MATIIKRWSRDEVPAGESVRGATFAYLDLAEKGDAYVKTVRQRASEAVQAAAAEADAIRDDARRQGLAAGEAVAEERIHARLQDHLSTLRPALDSFLDRLEGSRGEWLDAWSSAAVSLAVAIAERIVRRELAADPSISEAWVREALALSAGASEATLRLSPVDHARLGTLAESLVNATARGAELRVVADERVGPGGCVLETRHGVVDQRVETQLARLMEELG